MIYFREADLGFLFHLVAKHYARQEEVPDYTAERLGVDKLIGILNGVREDSYYPDVIQKAAYLLLQINKGHFFSNGNKRLALVTSVGFLAINDMALDPHRSKDVYHQQIQTLFPEFAAWEDQNNFSSEEFALYNISIIIADSQKYIFGDDPFNELKLRVTRFLSESLVPWDAEQSSNDDDTQV